MFSLRTALIALVGLAIAGALSIVAFRVEPESADLHVIDRGPMEVTVNADGVTRVREVYEVAAPVSGITQRSPVRVGDRVVAGETVVAIVEPAAAPILDARSRAEAEATVAEVQASVAAAEADLLAAEEQHRYAESNHNRITQMVDRGISSLTALEDSSLRLAAASAAVSAAASRRDMTLGALERAEATLAAPVTPDGPQLVEVIAPIDGVVLQVETLSERTVPAGTALLSLGDPLDLEIVADLLSSDAVRLPEGAVARAERWGGDTALEARLRRVDPVARDDVSALGIEEQRVDAVFDLITPPEDRARLGENYGVFLRIVLWDSGDTLRIPLAAAFHNGGGWATFVEDGGIATLRRIELGQIGTDLAEVLSGLEEGERVVLHPTSAINDGVQVVPRDGG